MSRLDLYPFDKKPLVNLIKFPPKPPIVTIVMLSWLRHYRLIECLDNLTRVLCIPVNLCLRVQECMNKGTQEKIIHHTNGFYDTDILFTRRNEGTGIPRHERLHKALDKYNTEFIFFTDDDMIIPRHGIEFLIAFLQSYPEYGAVNLHCKPKSNVWFFDKNERLTHKRPKSPFDESVALGSATLLVRKEVFDTCDIDNRYTIGCADIDLGLQMNKAGWKMGCMAIPEIYAMNKKGGCSTYNATRTDPKIVKNSVKLFQQKWNQKL